MWNVEEANAALAWVRERVERLRTAAGRPSTNGAPSGNGDGRGSAQQILSELNEQGIVLRDPARGLIDFHAVSRSGRPYWLCWLLDEPEVGWWHWPEDGFAGRRPLSDPPE